jgi:hypothetical protein
MGMINGFAHPRSHHVQALDFLCGSGDLLLKILQVSTCLDRLTPLLYKLVAFCRDDLNLPMEMRDLALNSLLIRSGRNHRKSKQPPANSSKGQEAFVDHAEW